MGIEPIISSVPRKCSTIVLLQREGNQPKDLNPGAQVESRTQFSSLPKTGNNRYTTWAQSRLLFPTYLDDIGVFSYEGWVSLELTIGFGAVAGNRTRFSTLQGQNNTIILRQLAQSYYIHLLPDVKPELIFNFVDQRSGASPDMTHIDKLEDCDCQGEEWLSRHLFAYYSAFCWAARNTSS